MTLSAWTLSTVSTQPPPFPILWYLTQQINKNICCSNYSWSSHSRSTVKPYQEGGSIGHNSEDASRVPDADLGISPILIHGLMTQVERKRRKLIIVFCGCFSLPFLFILNFSFPEQCHWILWTVSRRRKGNYSESTIFKFRKIPEPHPFFSYYLLKYIYVHIYVYICIYLHTALLSFPGHVR